MTMMKMIYKAIRIEIFIVGLCGVFFSINAWEIKLVSWAGILVLIGSLLLFLWLDKEMVCARPEITRFQGLQRVGILTLLGLFLLFSPVAMLQMTKLDSFNAASMILGIIILMINLILFAALWIAPHSNSAG